jgi:hypothetical protein
MTEKRKRSKRMTKKVVWYVYRPTRMGRVEPPALWELERVWAGSTLDRLLDRGRNDAGEVINLPGEWWRFESRAHAEAWLRSQAWQWERQRE